MRWWLLGLASVFGCVLAAGPSGDWSGGQGAARAASFDCGHAAKPSEVAICANVGLSILDGELGSAYAQRVARDPSVRQLERGWILVRDAGCGRSVACLTRLTNAQLAWLRSGAAMTGALPRTPGTCSLSPIREVGTRLGGDYGSGSAVAEANGAEQISYDQIPAVDRSRAADPALVCLISLPQHCPPGDDRGKIYGVANLRTLGVWSGPDAEHMCGGA
jgi:uncharacterized protein